MDAYVLAHVREQAGGPVILTPVHFAWLSCEASSVSEAVDELRPRLIEALQELEPVDRLKFREPVAAEILRRPAEVRVGGKGGDSIELQLGLVVVEQTVRGRSALIAFSPLVPNFQVLQRHPDRDRLADKAIAALTKQMRSWTPSAVLAADEPDDTRLETIELTVPVGTADRDHRQQASGSGILKELGIELTGRDGGRIDRRDALVSRVLETLRL